MPMPAKKEPTAAERKEDLKENIIAVAIVALLCAGMGLWIYYSMFAPPSAPSNDTRIDVSIGSSPIMGSDNASVTVIEFSDFECPYCGDFASKEFPIIKARYIDTGEVRFVFKQLPLADIHPAAELAAEASLCAQDQGKFWEYHDLLYAHQDKLGLADLESYAGSLGLDNATFDSCLTTGLRAGDVAADEQAGKRAGVTGTPTFFFNGRKVVGAISADDFGQQVAQELAAKS